MRKFWITVFLSGFLFPLLLFSQDITLEQCREWARENYPSCKKQGLLEQNRDYAVSNVNMVYLPQLSLSGQATYQSEVTRIDLPKSIEASGISIPHPDQDQYQISATLYQVIWDGGNVDAVKQEIIAREKIARQELALEMRNIEKLVDRLYFGVLLLNAQLNTQKLWEEELNRNLQKLDTYIANGVGNELDRDKLRVEQLKAFQQREHLEGTRRGMLDALNMLMGKHLQNTNHFVMPQEVEFSDIISPNRPELLLLDAQSDLLTAQESGNMADNMPSVGAFIQGGYGKPGLNFLSNEFSPFWIGGIKLSWNLGNLYTYGNKKRSLKLQKQMVDLQKETVKYNLCTQRNQERSGLLELQSLLKTDQEIIRLREQIKKATETKVENGVADISDLLKETSEWKLAKEMESLHRVQYIMKLYTLKNITE